MEKPNSRIHVCARVRPIIPEDYKLGTVIRSSPEICVHLKSDGQTIKMTKDVYDIKMFRVDHTFDGVSSQMDVYNSSFKKIVIDALGGFNGTGMCYGQTGSGKSHTIFGSEKEPGLVQCAVNDVFNDVRARIERGLVANVFLSFYQLYCEQAFDLLVAPVNGKIDSVALAVREDIVKGAFVENLQYIYVDDEESTMDVLRQGLKNRKVNSTQFNMSSSRSHAIFQMYLDFEEPEDSSNGHLVTNGTKHSSQDYQTESSHATKKFNVRRRILTFVDLAGSERVQAHHASKSKAQFKESVTINKSISALGNCIQALANNSAEQEQGYAESYNYQSKRNLHIPFRDCKLTRLLAEPLGGNSKTCIIVNIGPCTYNYEETKSTLKFAKRAMAVKKIVRKSEIEQLQVQDVHTEVEPEAEDPSPLRPAIGTKKVASVKVSRIVVRESPEERLRRSADFTTDYSFHDGVMNVNDEDERDEQGNVVNTFESVRSQLQYSTSKSDRLPPDKPVLHSPKPGHGGGGGYVLHLPAGTVFDAYGSVVSTDETGQQQAVRLNLSDFLKACQARSSVPTTATHLTEVPPTLSANGNTVFSTQNATHTVSNSATDGNDVSEQSNIINGMHTSQLKLSLPADTLSLDDLTPININSSTKSNFNSFFNVSTPPAKDLSLDWASTPASSGKPPLSPGLNRLVSSKHLNNAIVQNSCDAPPPAPPLQNQTSRDETSQSILLPSPHPNIENIPTLRLSESTTSTPATAVGQSEKLFEEVVTHRTQRKFVWERGSGETSHASTVEVTPLLSKHRGRIADVAAVAPVSINHYFKTYAEEPQSEERSKSAPPRSPAAKRVTKYLKHTPSADADVTLRSNTTTPGTEEKQRTATPPSTRRPSLSAISVRDETNSLPRSIAPQPTPSPKYLSPASAHKTKEVVGPYTFHKVNPAPATFEVRTEKKRSASVGAANHNAKPVAKLATTRKPFGRGQSPAVNHAKKAVQDQPRDLEGRLNAVSEMDESGNRPHSVLISLVHELRDELQRKEEEISSLRSFILNN